MSISVAIVKVRGRKEGRKEVWCRVAFVCCVVPVNNKVMFYLLYSMDFMFYVFSEIIVTFILINLNMMNFNLFHI